jgi:ribonuclease P protein component
MPAGPVPRHSLGRSARLKQGRDFVRLKQAGRRLVHGCLIANWLELPTGANARVGVVVSRKVGNAVQRSRARRLLRETFRLHRHELAPPVELVLVARPSIAGRKLSEVEKDFLGTMRRAGLLKAAGEIVESSSCSTVAAAREE